MVNNNLKSWFKALYLLGETAQMEFWIQTDINVKTIMPSSIVLPIIIVNCNYGDLFIVLREE